jgi:ribonucleoside-diphosphate reductase alpha chain
LQGQLYKEKIPEKSPYFIKKLLRKLNIGNFDREPSLPQISGIVQGRNCCRFTTRKIKVNAATLDLVKEKRTADTEQKPALDFLPTLYQQQIHQAKYARWRDDLGRREAWPETVDRYVQFFIEHTLENLQPLEEIDWYEIRSSILSLDVLPSMRALMTAGPALKRDHVAGYNCAFLAIDRPHAFDEALYILCCGTGVGFSVETQNVSKLPSVPEQLYTSDSTIVVPDSKIGWATSLRQLLGMLYAGIIPQYDLSKVRPAGAKLKTFGGRASGSAPLEALFQFCIDIFRGAIGRKLTSYECHSIMCKIGDIVVVGGVRRAALISLSDPADYLMRDAKQGQWWINSPFLALANNSAAWEGKPPLEQFIDEWKALIKSQSGERGFYNREAARARMVESGRRDPDGYFGLNPCGEINLKSGQFCNLSQVTIRANDTCKDIKRKIRIATIIGTLQSSLTDFRYLSSKWQKNCEEERLLGVGMTGIMENSYLNNLDHKEELAITLREWRDYTIQINEEYSEKIGINPSKAITCIKPAGNSTQLLGGHGSGLHEVHAPFYIRRNRGNKNDPVAQLLYYQGIPTEDEILHPDSTWVFSYPMKAPEGSITRKDRTAIERLEHWLVFAENWCEHNPSITISVKEDEWLEVGAWVYRHFDKMIGVSFLPYSEHTYQQAPYEEIDEKTYNDLVAQMPKSIDWSFLKDLEKDDQTVGSQELACVSGACEI